MLPKRIWEKVKNQDWIGFFIEFILVILGIFIAYQLTVASERRSEKRQVKTLILNLKLENEKNLEEFEELKEYRDSTVKWTESFYLLLNKDTNPEIDSMEFYIAKLFRISTPDLQQQNLITFINSTNSQKELELKSVALRLKAYYDEWLEGSDDFHVLKQENFFNYLADAFDFRTGKIVDEQKLRSLFFKNKVQEIFFSELEQSRLYSEARTQCEDLQTLIEAYLKQ